MPDIHEVATLTAKDQVTAPKSIRQALGVDADDKDLLTLAERCPIVTPTEFWSRHGG